MKKNKYPITWTKENFSIKIFCSIPNIATGILVKALPNAAFTINGGYSLFTDFNKSINGAFVKVGYVF